jgi:hypothetical protein
VDRGEIERRFPFAVSAARELKAIFGESVRLLKATEASDELVSAAHHVSPVPAEPPAAPQTTKKQGR